MVEDGDLSIMRLGLISHDPWSDRNELAVKSGAKILSCGNVHRTKV